ncbi:hypothetical protein KR215_008347 [Drosophila sulfurigaster]|nr:hypothetical protein KR215_008347 [Drosophila sulfurigaster]
MKLLLVAACLTLFVVRIRTQNCRGAVSTSCDKGPDPGHGRGNCSRNANQNMWFHSYGICIPFNYLGCGGNRNRYCTRKDCMNKCIRNRRGPRE